MMDRLQTRIEIEDITFNVSTNHASFTGCEYRETRLHNFDHWDIFLVKDGQASYLNRSGYSIKPE